MIKKRILLVFLTGIIILAAILRLWQLGNVPPSPDWDEVALGYNAYSILHTGKDEFGKFLPVVLRSFDDYKPALYAYLSIPTILIFGLNTFAVRLPAAIFGIVLVISVFYLIRELFKDNKYRDYLSLLASFFVAISPWSIQFSRVGFESHVGTVLNCLSALFFLKGLKKPWLLFLSAIFAGLSIYVYQSEKVFTPLLLIILVLIYKKDFFALKKKYIIISFLIGFLVVLPMFIFILNNRAALLRVTGTSIFSYQTELLKTNIEKLERDKKNNDLIGAIFDNRRFVYAKTIVLGYIVHFDPNWLFIRGDISRHHAPNMGLLYLFELPFVLLGIYYLIFGGFDKKTKLLLFSWFLLSPVPASITTGVPHAVRTMNFIPSLQILSAIGLLYAFLLVNKLKLRWFFYAVFSLVFLFNFSYYLNQYFIQLNYYDSKDWQYGYEQAVDEVKLLQNNYKEIIISDSQPMDKSYMFFLFYLKYSPVKYQKIGEKSSGSFVAHHSFGKYTFRQIDWEKDSLRKNVLLVATPGEIPKGVSAIKTIYNFDNTPAIKIVGIK